MNKYKIGDHVVVEESNIEWIDKCAGRTGVIENIWPTPHEYAYCVNLDDKEGLALWCKVKCLVDEHNTIARVIFNDPATVILWKDGTKTIAKAVKGDKYDPEKGFAIAYAKKFAGKTFREEMEKWCAPVVVEMAKNEPITMAELLQMDGQKVWLSSIYDGEENFDDVYCGWHTVNGRENKLEDERGYGYDIPEMNDRMGYRAYLKPQTGKKG